MMALDRYSEYKSFQEKIQHMERGMAQVEA